MSCMPSCSKSRRRNVLLSSCAQAGDLTPSHTCILPVKSTARGYSFPRDIESDSFIKLCLSENSFLDLPAELCTKLTGNVTFNDRLTHRE